LEASLAPELLGPAGLELGSSRDETEAGQDRLVSQAGDAWPLEPLGGQLGQATSRLPGQPVCSSRGGAAGGPEGDTLEGCSWKVHFGHTLPLLEEASIGLGSLAHNAKLPGLLPSIGATPAAAQDRAIYGKGGDTKHVAVKRSRCLCFLPQLEKTTGAMFSPSHPEPRPGSACLGVGEGRRAPQLPIGHVGLQITSPPTRFDRQGGQAGVKVEVAR